MDGDIISAFEQFGGVWKRVRGENADLERTESNEARSGDPAVIRRFMEEAAQMAHLYRGIARAVRTPVCLDLMRLKAQEEIHLKMLGTEHFLITGEKFTPGPACPLNCGVLTALRLCRRTEEESCGRYLQEAEKCRCSELGELFETLAEEEKEHSAEIKRMVFRLI